MLQLVQAYSVQVLLHTEANVRANSGRGAVTIFTVIWIAIGFFIGVWLKDMANLENPLFSFLIFVIGFISPALVSTTLFSVLDKLERKKQKQNKDNSE